MARAARGPFTPRDGDAARAFVRSVISGAGTVPISRRAVDPARWSDAYAARVANRLRADAAAGTPLSLQRARRGPSLVQAPRLREGKAPTRVRATGLVSREFRSVTAAVRWLRNRPEFPGGAFQVTASGYLLPEYSSIAYTAGSYSWRTLLTGFGGTLRAGTGVEVDTAEASGDALRRVASAYFERVETWEVRVFP